MKRTLPRNVRADNGLVQVPARLDMVHTAIRSGHPACAIACQEDREANQLVLKGHLFGPWLLYETKEDIRLGCFADLRALRVFIA